VIYQDQQESKKDEYDSHQKDKRDRGGNRYFPGQNRFFYPGRLKIAEHIIITDIVREILPPYHLDTPGKEEVTHTKNERDERFSQITSQGREKGDYPEDSLHQVYQAGSDHQVAQYSRSPDPRLCLSLVQDQLKKKRNTTDDQEESPSSQMRPFISPGMIQAVVPRIAMHIPVSITTQVRRKVPSGVLPVVMTCMEERTRSRPYVLSGL
jgi:hypothetical protein